MNEEERTKLKTLLNYWIEHNKEHSGEFKEWAERIKDSGENEISDVLLQATREMDKATECLLKASGMFG